MLSLNINTNITNAFFEQFRKEADPNVHVVMVWNRADFHTSKDFKIPENITIVALPPYSPELNTVENLWRYLRSHYRANRSYANYDDLRYAAIDAWQNAAVDPEIIKSVCRTSYAERIN